MGKMNEFKVAAMKEALLRCLSLLPKTEADHIVAEMKINALEAEMKEKKGR